MSHFKRRKPRTQVRCVMCTPRGDAKEAAGGGAGGGGEHRKRTGVMEAKGLLKI
jgi:hypothetical protein